MSLVMFTSQGVHYTAGPAGPVVAMLMPNPEQIRTFADLDGSNKRDIAERYAANDREPIWRLEKGQVKVYGVLPTELRQRREDVSIFLSQDFAPPKADLFYFLLGKRWLIHGEKMRNDEGQEIWLTSKFDLKDEDPVKFMHAIIAEQKMTNMQTEICVAVHENRELFQELKQNLQDYNIAVERMERLRPKGKPLFRQRNYSLLMMTTALLAFLLLLAASAYWFLNSNELESINQKIRVVQREIAQIKLNERIGYIRNPDGILALMNRQIQQAPSAIAHYGASIAAAFGELQKLEFTLQSGTVAESTVNSFQQNPEGKFIIVTGHLDNVVNTLLVDQESVARTALEVFPALKNIESINQFNAKRAQLKMKLRVE